VDFKGGNEMRSQKNMLKFKNWITCILCFTFITTLVPISIRAKEKNILTVGEIYNGFTLIEKKTISEIDSNALVFEHKKNGAHVLYLQNEDINKVFSIDFYTPPTDDTGVNHILEHSVLYGSEKYPVKSPLMEVFKTSVSTFANAYTSYDKTSYPFASNNDKDFKNIMGIYMDAVFFPNFKKDSRIFSQEGWRYELDSKDGELKYNGVVYNEMKANYSSPNFTLDTSIKKSLYPDTIYNWETGGNPEVMPTLTYEKALDTYNKNYHPSNSYIYLYGNLNILDTLKFLEEQYLSKFDKKDYECTINKQKSFDSRRIITSEYALPKEADTKNKTYLALNYAIDLESNKEDLIGLQLLADILVNSDTSPLKDLLVKENGGSNLTASFNSSMLQPYFSFKLDGSEEVNSEAFSKSLDSALNDIVKKGLDKSYIHSVFNSIEMQLRSNKTKGATGLSYLENATIGWLYHRDSTRYLETEQSIENIRKSIISGYFEKLIQKYFIDNKHSSLVILKPKAGLAEEVAASTKKTLEEYKSKLSEQQLNQLLNDTKTFKEWQNSPDSKEALDTIPTLTIEDIDTTESITTNDEKTISEVKVLNHPMYTNKLTYTNMYFDSSTVPQDMLKYLYLLSSLLGRVDTENYPFEELHRRIVDVGGISFYPTSIAKFKDSNVYFPKFIVSSASLTDRIDESLELTNEIINKTKFDNKEEIRKYIKETKANMESNLSYMSDTIGNSKLQSYISTRGKYDNIGVLDYYKFITDIDANFDSKSDEIIKRLNEVSKLLFNKNNLIVGITADKGDSNKVEDSLGKFIKNIKNNNFKKYDYKFDNSIKNEGFSLPSNVQYVYKGANINDLGYKYKGSMLVLSKILSMEYLMNEVREKGGAYGTGFSISTEGNAVFSSYRDPNIKETLDVYKKASDFLKDFNADDKKMNSYILGLVSSVDNLYDPSTKGARADSYYISGRTVEDDKEIRKEILATKAKDISAFADLIDAIINANTFTVVGNGEKLQENKELFTNMHNLVKDKPTEPVNKKE
jgi:Zn-dependent M16 (insulinase) family peptidase